MVRANPFHLVALQHLICRSFKLNHFLSASVDVLCATTFQRNGRDWDVVTVTVEGDDAEVIQNPLEMLCLKCLPTLKLGEPELTGDHTLERC